MSLPTEPIGSLPRPPALLAGLTEHVAGRIGRDALDAPYDDVVQDTITDPIDPVVETPEQVRDRVLRAAEYLSPDRLGTCDDCGFAPFGDDVSTSRETAWAKVPARVESTALASERLGV